MKITEVRLKLVDFSRGNQRLHAFCTVTFDDMFVVRDLKVILGEKGRFLAMPSRRITDHCPNCRGKNHLQALYCNYCGQKLPDLEDRAQRTASGKLKLYADIAHPINAGYRKTLQNSVIQAYLAATTARQEEAAVSIGEDGPNITGDSFIQDQPDSFGSGVFDDILPDESQ